jgi:hypothetical protein
MTRTGAGEEGMDLQETFDLAYEWAEEFSDDPDLQEYFVEGCIEGMALVWIASLQRRT